MNATQTRFPATDTDELTQTQIYHLILPALLDDSKGWIAGFHTDRDSTNHQLSMSDLKARAKSTIAYFVNPEPNDPASYHEIAKAIEQARFDVEEVIVLTLIQAMYARFGAAKANEFMTLESL